MTQDTVIEIYEKLADWFDGARNKSLVERPVLDSVVELLPDEPTALDLGCGTGEPIARYLIDCGLAVTGVDGATAMVKYCQSRSPDQIWIHSDLRSFDTNRTFDLVIAWDSLFHLACDDQRRLLERVKGWTRPGGFLIFNSGTEESAFWSPMRGYESLEMFHASLDTAEYRQRLEEGGFKVLRHVVEDPRCGGRTFWVAQRNTAASHQDEFSPESS